MNILKNIILFSFENTFGKYENFVIICFVFEDVDLEYS